LACRTQRMGIVEEVKFILTLTRCFYSPDLEDLCSELNLKFERYERGEGYVPLVIVEINTLEELLNLCRRCESQVILDFLPRECKPGPQAYIREFSAKFEFPADYSLEIYDEWREPASQEWD